MSGGLFLETARELARGASTGLVLWAGVRCPDCTCAPVIHVPDCQWSTEGRIIHKGFDVQFVVLAGLFGFLAGLLVANGFAQRYLAEEPRRGRLDGMRNRGQRLLHNW